MNNGEHNVLEFWQTAINGIMALIAFGSLIFTWLMFKRSKRLEDDSRKSSDAAIASAKASEKSSEVAKSSLDFEIERYSQEKEESRRKQIAASIKDLSEKHGTPGRSEIRAIISHRDTYDYNEQELEMVVRGLAQEGTYRNPDQLWRDIQRQIQKIKEENTKEMLKQLGEAMTVR